MLPYTFFFKITTDAITRTSITAGMSEVNRKIAQNKWQSQESLIINDNAIAPLACIVAADDIYKENKIIRQKLVLNSDLIYEKMII